MIVAIELLSLLSTLTLALLWIFNPTANFEPYTIISGVVFAAVELYRRRTKAKTEQTISLPTGMGGAGGNAKVGNGYAIGGKGGRGGVPGSGSGGAGGDAEAVSGLALGGEGGDAGQSDGGGKGGRSGFEVLGRPNYQFPDGTWLWDYGRGGDGADPADCNDNKQERDNESEKPLR